MTILLDDLQLRMQKVLTEGCGNEFDALAAATLDWLASDKVIEAMARGVCCDPDALYNGSPRWKNMVPLIKDAVAALSEETT